MMNLLTCELGDTMVRVVPSIDGSPAYAQAGIIDRITPDTIEVLVQVDVMRRMRFRRVDGLDCDGTGSFLLSGRYLGEVLGTTQADTAAARQPRLIAQRERG